MSLMSLAQNGAKQIAKFAVDNSPTILTSLGVAGVVTSVVLAVTGTTKAAQIIYEEKSKRAIDETTEKGLDKEPVYPEDIDLEPAEIIQLTWKCYVPTVGMSLATIACIIGSNTINANRYAALAGLYSLSETAFKEYKQEVVEKLGPKAEEKVMDGLAEKAVREHPVKTSEVIITGGGETLFLDSLSGRYFKSDMQKVRKAVNDFNSLLINHSPFMSVNEWYDCLNLEHVADGGYRGWTSDGLLDVHFSSQMTEDNETACVVVNYKILPHKE